MTDVHKCFRETKSSRENKMRESAANAQCVILKIPKNGKRMKSVWIFQVLYTICSLPNVMVFVLRLFSLILKFQKIPHHIRDFGLTMILQLWEMRNLNGKKSIQIVTIHRYGSIVYLEYQLFENRGSETVAMISRV